MLKNMNHKQATDAAVRQVMSYSDLQARIENSVVPVMALVTEMLFAAAEGSEAALENMDYCAKSLAHVLEMLQSCQDDLEEQASIISALESAAVEMAA